jgi:hypothetical protein
VALFRRTNEPDEPEAAPPDVDAAPGTKKARPTPTRKEAEAARRQRVTQTYSKKEARKYASQQARANRMRAINQREGAPDKALMRDYVDSRFNLGEFLLPSVVVILAITILGSYVRGVAGFATLAMYLFILLVIVDNFMMWRGFKKVLAARLPKASTKGLLMYGMTRATQLRRFRMPAPRVKRGDKY